MRTRSFLGSKSLRPCEVLKEVPQEPERFDLEAATKKVCLAHKPTVNKPTHYCFD